MNSCLPPPPSLHTHPQSSTTETPGLELAKLREVQKQLAQPYVVLQGKGALVAKLPPPAPGGAMQGSGGVGVGVGWSGGAMQGSGGVGEGVGWSGGAMQGSGGVGVGWSGGASYGHERGSSGQLYYSEDARPKP